MEVLRRWMNDASVEDNLGALSTCQTVGASLGAGNLGSLGAVAFSPTHGTAVDPVFREFACELVFILKLVPEA